MLKGFKEFIMRGSVIDLAVAFVIGLAFTRIVSSLVDGLITPLIAAIFGEPDLNAVGNFSIHNADFRIGLVLSAVFNFLAVAAAVYFLIVVPMNKFKKPAAVEAAGPTEIELLTEIRDSLKK